MTTISAKIIADSVSREGIRLTTMQLRYPRWIHAEGRTHRRFSIGEDEFDGWDPRTPSLMEDPALSRNASSSRAIPVERMIADVERDPAIPLYWGRNERGMQARAELEGAELEAAREEWMIALRHALTQARRLAEIGAHKQLVNRLLEPFSHINVVVTATDWQNFFALRRHDDAEPHTHMLADRMFEARKASTPRPLQFGDWHLPYADDLHFTTIFDRVRVSVARCARVSYLTHDGRTPSIAEDLDLYDGLVGSSPLHASPAEHQATPDRDRLWPRSGRWDRPDLHGNLTGWQQFRKMLHGENAGALEHLKGSDESDRSSIPRIAATQPIGCGKPPRRTFPQRLRSMPKRP